MMSSGHSVRRSRIWSGLKRVKLYHTKPGDDRGIDGDLSLCKYRSGHWMLLDKSKMMN